MSLVLRVFNSTFSGASLGTLDEPTRRSCMEEFSAPGTWAVELLNDDPDCALCQYGRIVRFDLDGTARFAGLIEGRRVVVIDPDEEAGERTLVTGRGTLAVWEDGIVEPELGTAAYAAAPADAIPTERAFDYGSSDLDISTAVAVVSDGPVGFIPGAGDPDIAAGWQDPAAERIWSVAPLTPPVAVGDIYLWPDGKTFTVTDAGTYRLFATADDGFEIKVDGRVVVADSKPFLWQQTREVDIYLTAGTHYLGVKASNAPRPASPATNVAYFLMSLWSLTNGGASLDDCIVRTDSTWKTIAYPANPPGFTVGKVIRLLKEEAQARGALSGMTLGFTDTLDSAGVAWPTLADIVVPVGGDLLSVLRQLAETHCDVAMSATALELDAYVQRGTVTGVDLEAGDNLGKLVHDGTG